MRGYLHITFAHMAELTNAGLTNTGLTNVQPKSYADTFGGKQIIIGVAGIIGVGKTTLTRDLAARLGFDEVKEPVQDNPYLPLFYKDMKKFGFAMQVFLLNKRFKHHQASVWGTKSAVFDRSIYEDVIFAKMLHEGGNMSDLDFETYCELFSNMTNFLHRPDVIIYLDASPEIALTRIKERGRECEQGLPLEYLKDLRAGYEDWISDVEGRIPVVRIDWTTYKSVDEVIELARSKMKRHLVTF